MTEGSDNDVIAIVRKNGAIRWYRADVEVWILDWNKWREDFRSAGHEVPEADYSERFGIGVVDIDTADEFLAALASRQLDRKALKLQFVERYAGADSWWDVEDLFPIAFVDFDQRQFGAFYPEGARIERYVPDGWDGRFVDFANEYPEDVFPAEEKFWMVDGVDLLRELNERAARSGG